MRPHGGGEVMKGVTIMNDPRLERADSRCDECGVKKRRTCNMCAFDVHRFVSIWFPTDRSKRLIHLFVCKCKCVLCVCVCFQACKGQVCGKDVTVWIVQEEECCFRGMCVF